MARNTILLPAVLLCLVFLLSGCSRQGLENTKESVTVTIVSSDEYYLADGYQHQVTVKCGEEVRILLYPSDGYIISGTDYSAGKVADGPYGSNVLILPSIRYPTRVNVLCEKDDNVRTITYDANGGMVCSSPSASAFIVHHVLNEHIFPNTAIGTDFLERDGYTLLGWNTAPDGTGDHVGLGSRYIGSQEVLYAQWVPWSEESLFCFAETEGGYTVTHYNGKENSIIIPEMHNGLPVVEISACAFENCQVQRLVLPITLSRVEMDAFVRCKVDKLFFFDTISEFPDAAFRETPLPQVFINAAQPPRYAGSGRASTYADKVDLLIQNGDRRKIVLFGGSGTYYSVLAAEMEEMLGGEYAVINMGMNGWFPAIPQLNVIRTYLHEGDILVHIPEASSSTQLFHSTAFSQTVNSPTEFDDRYMRSLELNYSLISLFDLNAVTGFFDSYTRFNGARQDQPATDYSDYSHYINANGDYPGKKLSYQLDEPITNEADICPWLLTPETCARMDSVYASFQQNGVRVCIAYAAVNESALATTEDYSARAALFDRILREDIQNAVVIEKIEDSFYPGGVFYNSDWHLSEEADFHNTAVIAEGLGTFLGVELAKNVN